MGAPGGFPGFSGLGLGSEQGQICSPAAAAGTGGQDWHCPAPVCCATLLHPCAVLLCAAAGGIKASIHPAALNPTAFNPGLPALAYFPLPTARLSCFHVALKTKAYTWLRICRHSLLFLTSCSFAEYFNNLYWDVFWRRLYFYMDKLHWSKYQVRTWGLRIFTPCKGKLLRS